MTRNQNVSIASASPGDVTPTLTEVEPPAGMDLDQVDWLLNRTFQPSIKSS